VPRRSRQLPGARTALDFPKGTTVVSNDNSTAAPSETLRSGRRSPKFVQTPEWVLVSGVSAPAQALYTVLLGHVNHAAGTGEAWPGMDALADMLGFRHRHSIARYVRELAQLGAIDVERKANSTDRRNIYTVHETPPEGYEGLRTIADFHTARRVRLRRSGPTDTERSLARGTERDLATDTERSQNQTKTTRRTSTRDASSEDASARTPAAGVHRQAGARATPKIFISKPNDFERYDDGRRYRYACRAAVAACKKAGVPMGRNAADRLGEILRLDGKQFQGTALLEEVEYVLNAGAAGDPEYAGLFVDHVRTARGGAPAGYEDLVDELGDLPGGEAAVATMWADGHHPNAIYSQVLKQNGLTA